MERFSGRVFSVVTDTVSMPGGGNAERDYIRHPGAVGVVALDDQHRVVLVLQYRHPVRRTLWELPAGLIDVPGEDPLPAAQRELAEEAELEVARVDLDEAVAMCFRGEITNGPAVAGILAAAQGRRQDWHGLRSPDAPRPGR